MHDQRISVRDVWTCVFCNRSVASGATVWRADQPYDVHCLVRTLAAREIIRPRTHTSDVGSSFGQPPAPRREPDCEPFQLHRGAS